MKILYIAVHSHIGWGAEYWLAKAFRNLGISIIPYDYHAHRKKMKTWRFIGKELAALEKESQPDIVLLQRGKNMAPRAIAGLKTPVVFWSTEPTQLKNDVDKLLRSSLFSWVFVHSYSCLKRIEQAFPHHLGHCSVMHNACPAEIVVRKSGPRKRFALFNRSLSRRRCQWLEPVQDAVTTILGRYGIEYFNDLEESSVAVNIHYSEKNLDDFESGIFEAMAKGCAVVTEKLDVQTLSDLGMEHALIQVDSPTQLKETLGMLKNNPDLLQEYQHRAQEAIITNTWDNRALLFLQKFNEICGL